MIPKIRFVFKGVVFIFNISICILSEPDNSTYFELFLETFYTGYPFEDNDDKKW